MEPDYNTLKLAKTEELLPIGSVVTVEPIQQALMIYGRKQQASDSDKTWDYVACPYPQGHLSKDSNVFFNHEQIKEVIFKGLETDGELQLRKKLREVFK